MARGASGDTTTTVRPGIPGTFTDLGGAESAIGGGWEVEVEEGKGLADLRDISREGAEGYRASREEPESYGALRREALGTDWP